MAKMSIGFDIGEQLLKIACCSGGKVTGLYAEELPDHFVNQGRIVSPEAMSQFLKETAKKYRIGKGDCRVILPGSQVFLRRITSPRMTISQLKLNLPYEFKDYISKEKDKYFYDYAVLRTSDEAGEDMELLGVAAEKELIDSYLSMFKRAGFQLNVAAPEECAFSNLLRRQSQLADQDVCIVDIGHSGTRIHIFSKGNFENTKVVDYGTGLLDEIIGDVFNVDPHVARNYKEVNYQQILEHERCQNLFSALGVEVMKTVNFYNFNNPQSELDAVYVCGGGALIEDVRLSIAEHTGLPVKSVAEILPVTPRDDQPAPELFAPAVGIALQ